MTRQRLPGVLLIMAGVIMLASTQAGVGAEIIVAAIGACFLAAYAATRQYGLLIPGGILTGLGAGIVAQNQTGYEGLVVLGLGLGFFAILLGDPGDGRWWPAIPGTVLVLVGFANLQEESGWVGQAARWWPAILILAGLWLLLRSRSGERS